uniref:Uncharacterized protein n=1 Tax=Solanum tuberosum TaxID=4113 RepID=M1BFK5_SOLTU
MPQVQICGKSITPAHPFNSPTVRFNVNDIKDNYCGSKTSKNETTNGIDYGLASPS